MLTLCNIIKNPIQFTVGREQMKTPNLLAAPAAQAAERRGVHGCEDYHVDEPEDHARPLVGGALKEAAGARRDDGRDDDEGDDAAQNEPEELQPAAVLVDEERADDHGEGPAGREGDHRQPAIAAHGVAERRITTVPVLRQHGGDQVREEVCERGVPDPDPDAERVLEEAVEAPAAPATAAAAAAEDALEDLDDDAVDDADRGHYHYEEEEAATIFTSKTLYGIFPIIVSLTTIITETRFQRFSNCFRISPRKPYNQSINNHRNAHTDEGNDVLIAAAHFKFLRTNRVNRF